MAYNITVSKTIGFKRGTCDYSVFAKCQGKVAEVVDKACDYCYYLSLETSSYHDRLSPVIQGRYVKNF